MFVAVQYLRAIAALLVVGIHVQEQLERAGWAFHVMDFGSAGVDIFFVISGFVMWHTTTRPTSSTSFYFRRIVRIVPLYWMLTSVMLAVLLIAPQLLNSARFDLGHIVASYLFIAQPHPVLEGAIFPLLVPGWTLNYEMFFYAIFGVSLMLGRELRLILVVGLFGALAAFNLLSEPGRTALGFYTDPILLEFAAGVILGYAVERGASIRPGAAAVLVLIGAALIIAHFDVIRFVRDGIGAILIVTGVVLAEARKPAVRMAFPMLIGDASYSLYLSHVLVLAALYKLFDLTLGFGSVWHAAAYGALALVAVIAASVVLYYGFEKPSLKLLNPKKPPPAAASA